MALDAAPTDRSSSAAISREQENRPRTFVVAVDVPVDATVLVTVDATVDVADDVTVEVAVVTRVVDTLEAHVNKPEGFDFLSKGAQGHVEDMLELYPLAAVLMDDAKDRLRELWEEEREERRHDAQHIFDAFSLDVNRRSDVLARVVPEVDEAQYPPHEVTQHLQ